jgi:hypothetical protein
LRITIERPDGYGGDAVVAQLEEEVSTVQPIAPCGLIVDYQQRRLTMQDQRCATCKRRTA